MLSNGSGLVRRQWWAFSIAANSKSYKVLTGVCGIMPLKSPSNEKFHAPIATAPHHAIHRVIRKLVQAPLKDIAGDVQQAFRQRPRRIKTDWRSAANGLPLKREIHTRGIGSLIAPRKQ